MDGIKRPRPRWDATIPPPNDREAAGLENIPGRVHRACAAQRADAFIAMVKMTLVTAAGPVSFKSCGDGAACPSWSFPCPGSHQSTPLQIASQMILFQCFAPGWTSPIFPKTDPSTTTTTTSTKLSFSSCLWWKLIFLCLSIMKTILFCLSHYLLHSQNGIRRFFPSVSTDSW